MKAPSWEGIDLKKIGLLLLAVFVTACGTGAETPKPHEAVVKLKTFQQNEAPGGCIVTITTEDASEFVYDGFDMGALCTKVAFLETLKKMQPAPQILVVPPGFQFPGQPEAPPAEDNRSVGPQDHTSVKF